MKEEEEKNPYKEQKTLEDVIKKIKRKENESRIL
jgi:hypothetical protein